jgi:hypothetical protein
MVPALGDPEVCSYHTHIQVGGLRPDSGFTATAMTAPTSPAAAARNEKSAAMTTAAAGLTNTPTGTLIATMTAATSLAPILTALIADL